MASVTAPLLNVASLGNSLQLSRPTLRAYLTLLERLFLVESKTDPDARLARKGNSHEAKLAYSAHVLMENRNGLCVDISVAHATGFAERAEAVVMIDRQKAKGSKPKTLGADRGYDTRDFVRELRERGVVPHVAQHKNKRRSAIDGRTIRHASYGISQRIRKRVEESSAG